MLLDLDQGIAVLRAQGLEMALLELVALPGHQVGGVGCARRRIGHSPMSTPEFEGSQMPTGEEVDQVGGRQQKPFVSQLHLVIIPGYLVLGSPEHEPGRLDPEHLVPIPAGSGWASASRIR